MRNLFLLPILAVLFLFAANESASAHGGKYIPPGDGVGPGFGNPAGPGSPGGTSGPTTPGTQGPVARGPRGPVTPPAPPKSGPRRNGAFSRKNQGSASSWGIERWEIWWENNKDAFLDLKNRIGSSRTYSGTGSFLTGRGRKDTAQPSGRPSTEVIRNEVLPALIAALDSDHPDVLDSALLAIARSTPDGDADLLLAKIEALLDSKFVSVRQATCLSLGVLGSPKA